MKLENIFIHINENCKVQVISYFSKEVLATYDGRENIPNSYNHYHLLEINVKDNVLELYI